MEEQCCLTIRDRKFTKEIHPYRRLRIESESEIDKAREVGLLDQKEGGNEYPSLIMSIRLSMILLFIALQS